MSITCMTGPGTPATFGGYSAVSAVYRNLATAVDTTFAGSVTIPDQSQPVVSIVPTAADVAKPGGYTIWITVTYGNGNIVKFKVPWTIEPD